MSKFIVISSCLHDFVSEYTPISHWLYYSYQISFFVIRHMRTAP